MDIDESDVSARTNGYDNYKDHHHDHIRNHNLDDNNEDDEDLLEGLTNLESKFYTQGYSEGHAHGALHGLFEGRELGKEKAFEIWEEVGYYEGWAKGWVELLSLSRSVSADAGGGPGSGAGAGAGVVVVRSARSKEARALAHAQHLLTLISTFPTTNPTPEAALAPTTAETARPQSQVETERATETEIAPETATATESDIDLSALISTIRARYRLLCASLGARPRLIATRDGAVSSSTLDENQQSQGQGQGHGHAEGFEGVNGAAAGANVTGGTVIEGIDGPMKGKAGATSFDFNRREPIVSHLARLPTEVGKLLQVPGALEIAVQLGTLNNLALVAKVMLDKPSELAMLAVRTARQQRGTIGTCGVAVASNS